MALSPNVVVVAPGDLITAAHLNNVRANLDRLDTTTLKLAGGVVTGNVQLGADPAANAAAGLVVRPDGIISSRVVTPTSASSPNLFLARAGAGPGDVGAYFIDFRRSAASSGAPSQVGSITLITGPGVAYNVASDGRNKHDDGPLVDAVARLLRLRPRRLRWRADYSDDTTSWDGFIAQDVAQVVPEAVSGDPDGDRFEAPMQLDASKLIPVLVAAVQELVARVGELTLRLDDVT